MMMTIKMKIIIEMKLMMTTMIMLKMLMMLTMKTYLTQTMSRHIKSVDLQETVLSQAISSGSWLG